MFKKNTCILLTVAAFTVFAAQPEAKGNGKNILKPEKKTHWTGSTAAIYGEGVMQIKGNVTAFSKKSLQVEKGKVYKINLELGKSSGSGTVTLGYVCYDKSGKIILPLHVNTVSGSDTELAVPCSFTDEKIIVKDGSKWQKGPGGCAAFNTKKNRSDLPNKNLTRPGISDVKKLANGTWEISFDEEIGKEYPKGTGVRQHRAGATYDYFYSAGISPNSFKSHYLRSRFRPGTEKIGLLIFVRGAKNCNLQIKKFSIEEYKK